jgi:hypothetical protein
VQYAHPISEVLWVIHDKTAGVDGKGLNCEGCNSILATNEEKNGRHEAQ